MDVDVLDDTPEVCDLLCIARCAGVLTLSFQMIHNIPQPDFEQFVTDSLARESLVEIRRGVSFVSLEQVR